MLLSLPYLRSSSLMNSVSRYLTLFLLPSISITFLNSLPHFPIPSIIHHKHCTLISIIGSPSLNDLLVLIVLLIPYVPHPSSPLFLSPSSPPPLLPLHCSFSSPSSPSPPPPLSLPPSLLPSHLPPLPPSTYKEARLQQGRLYQWWQPRLAPRSRLGRM